MPGRFKPLGSILEGFRPMEEAVEPHKPHTLIITCVDSRLGLEYMFNLGPNEALIYRPIAALVPPYNPETKQKGLEALLCFGADIKRIRNILIMVHTDCGGATLASLPRDNDLCAQTPVQVVRSFLKTSGLDLNTLREQFRDQADPDEIARLLGIQSLHNILTYPSLEERVRSGEIDVALTCYDMHKKSLTFFDLQTESWKPIADFQGQSRFVTPANDDAGHGHACVCQNHPAISHGP